MYRYFEEKSDAEHYLKYRISYPPEVVEKITEYMAEKLQGPYTSAVDVGCGSGQLTRSLALKFDHVTGVDVSQSQIDTAKTADNPDNITFKVGRAEDLPLAGESVELVTSATASHYFDWKEFRKEVDRALKPNGCLAILSYNFVLVDHPDPEIRKKLDQCIMDCTDWYNDPRLTGSTPEMYKHVQSEYQELPLPYTEQHTIKTEIRHNMTVADFIECNKTYAVFIELLKNNPDTYKKCFEDLQKRLLDTLGSTSTAEETRITTVSPVWIRVARKTSTT